MKTYSRKKSGETQDVILDLNELCRLCMAKEDELVPIFNNDDPIPLTLRIMACVALEVFEGDGLPNKICHPCKFQLEKSYNFRKKCESSDMKLRQHLKSIQAKIGDVDLTAEDGERMDVEGEQTDKQEDAEEPSTEEDLVGVAQVAYIQPDADPEDDPESITLPPEAELINKDACTLKSMKREVIDVEEPDGEGVIFVDEANQEMEDTSYDAIADAVKATLATQPDSIKKEPKTEFDITQPESAEITRRILNKLLPTKSSNVYQAAYQKLVKWCEENGANNYSENELMAYFNELAAKRNMKGSTLWSHYSMIKSLLNINHGVDITKYLKLRAYLKKMNELYVPKKSKSFTKEQFEKFLTEAPDKKYLAMKVVLIIGRFGACLVEEMVRMKIDDIEDLGSLLYIKIPDGEKSRSFTIVGDNYINTYRKYASLRPTEMDNRRFFLKYENGKCHRVVMGVHKIGSVPREVASYLNLPNWREYTGHCLKQSSTTLQLGLSGRIKRSRGWKSSSVAEDVAEDEDSFHMEEPLPMEASVTIKEEFVTEDWSPYPKSEAGYTE